MTVHLSEPEYAPVCGNQTFNEVNKQDKKNHRGTCDGQHISFSPSMQSVAHWMRPRFLQGGLMLLGRNSGGVSSGRSHHGSTGSLGT